MIGYEMPEFIKKLQKSIPNEELYLEDGKMSMAVKENVMSR